MTSIMLASEFVVVNCGADGCDQTFAMSRRFYDETQNGLGWCCPRGHHRVWRGKTTRQQLEEAQAREVHLADQLHAAEAEAELMRSQLVRDRYRYSRGVCPCCNRSFPALARHISKQHPDYDPGDVRKKIKGYECSCGRTFETPHGLAIHQGRSRTSDWTNPKRSKWGRHLTVTA